MFVDTCTLRGHKEAYPTLLETILRAKSAFLSKLETGGTLESARFIVTFITDTTLFASLGCRHDEITDCQKPVARENKDPRNKEKCESLCR